jgi:hypothetical protein
MQHSHTVREAEISDKRQAEDRRRMSSLLAGRPLDGRRDGVNR